MEFISVASSEREEFIDITPLIEGAMAGKGWNEGAILLFCQHTTCGLTINEGADPAVRRDLLRFFREAAPVNNNWLHYEGNTDAHIKCSILGVSLAIPVQAGRLALGRWQSVYLFEADGPRNRTVLCQFLPGPR